MKILDFIDRIGMKILQLALSLCNFVGNNIVTNIRDMGFPLMEVLEEYINLPYDSLVSMVGAVGFGLSLLLIRTFINQLQRARITAWRIKQRRKYMETYDRPREMRMEGSREGPSSGAADTCHGLYDQDFLFDQLNDLHLDTHQRMMEEHLDFINNIHNETFINESMNHCMEDAYNDATPCDFGGHADSIFDNDFGSIDNDFGSFDNDFGGFDSMGGFGDF